MNWRFLLIILFILSYVVIGILQIVASIDGILYFFGLHWIFAVLAAVLLLFIPAIGPLAGVYGAVMVWDWSVWSALILFFWPYIFYLALIALGFSASFWSAKELRRYMKGKPKIIDAEYIVQSHKLDK